MFIGFRFLLSRIDICKSPGVDEREHIAIDEVQVAAFFCRDAVEVFQLTDVVGGHPAVLPRGGVPVHAALVIAAQQAFHIEFEEVLFLFFRREQGAGQGLLPAHYPRVQRVLHELQRLLLNIRKARLLQIADHVGRHPENSSDFIDLELASLKELRLLRCDGDRRVLHALLQNRNLPGVLTSGEALIPALANAVRIFHRAGVFQEAARCRAVGEELRAVLLGGNGEADGILGHRNRAVADKAIEAEAGDVQYVRWLQDHRPCLHGRRIGVRHLVAVKKLPGGITVHGHTVGHERVQRHDLTLAVTDDLRVGVAPQEQVRHQCLPEDEGAHLRIGLVVQQQVQRMPDGLFLAAIVLVGVQVQRKPCDGLRQNADAGVNGGHLHGGAFRHGFARRAAAKEEAVAAAVRRVGRLIPRMEEAA